VGEIHRPPSNRFGPLAKPLCSRGEIDLEKKFEPSLLNTAIYLLGLSQQVSTFVLNFQGRPFREGIRENPPLYWGLLGVSAVAYCGATDFIPELNRWLQLVEMSTSVSVPGVVVDSVVWFRLETC
jgi:cation-transporting ATPase 13A1